MILLFIKINAKDTNQNYKTINCTGHVEAVGEVAGSTFFVIYIDCTGNVEAVGEVSGPTFFVIYI
jgi:hypothetical protein